MPASDGYWPQENETPQKKQGLALDVITQIHRSIWYFQCTLERASLLRYEDKHMHLYLRCEFKIVP